VTVSAFTTLVLFGAGLAAGFVDAIGGGGQRRIAPAAIGEAQRDAAIEALGGAAQ
jgi:F0F1-type ATP synthase membrane subunit c/vacuolar-type H+-ATPase subunit K